jgi:hypothetical protein
MHWPAPTYSFIKYHLFFLSWNHFRHTNSHGHSLLKNSNRGKWPWRRSPGNTVAVWHIRRKATTWCWCIESSLHDQHCVTAKTRYNIHLLLYSKPYGSDFVWSKHDARFSKNVWLWVGILKEWLKYN